MLCLTSSGLNILLPARAGDIFRGIFVGSKYKVDKIKVLGAILLERIFDIFIIFCFLIVGILIYNKNQTAIYLCSFSGLCMLFSISLIIYAFKYNKTDDICNFLKRKTEIFPFKNITNKIITLINNTCNSIFNGFEIMANKKKILQIILASLGIWFFECVNFYIIICSFGLTIHWSVTMFLISFIAMACMIPSASIFVGPYQMAAITAFSLYNINKETALAVTLTEQTIVTIVTALSAALFFFLNGMSYKSVKENIEKDIIE